MLLALGNTLGEALGVAELFELEETPKGVLILQGAMPRPFLSYLFAARYDRRPDDIAGIVLVSTIVGALLSPLLIAYVLGVAA